MSDYTKKYAQKMEAERDLLIKENKKLRDQVEWLEAKLSDLDYWDIGITVPEYGERFEK
jgi:hypothetical protein